MKKRAFIASLLALIAAPFVYRKKRQEVWSMPIGWTIDPHPARYDFVDGKYVRRPTVFKHDATYARLTKAMERRSMLDSTALYKTP